MAVLNHCLVGKTSHPSGGGGGGEQRPKKMPKIGLKISGPFNEFNKVFAGGTFF